MMKLTFVALLLMAVSVAGCGGSSSEPSTPNSPSTNPAAGDEATAPIKGYEISGTIKDGGDTTPPDLQDAPRKFVYTVKTDDEQTVTLTYTAYPPSPNPAAKKIRLTFHAGEILIGDYVKARGTFDPQTKTLVVAEEGDSIETFASRP
jgi:hypothetical protein